MGKGYEGRKMRGGALRSAAGRRKSGRAVGYADGADPAKGESLMSARKNRVKHRKQGCCKTKVLRS